MVAFGGPIIASDVNGMLEMAEGGNGLHCLEVEHRRPAGYRRFGAITHNGGRTPLRSLNHRSLLLIFARECA
jgi:hypothetical protein